MATCLKRPSASTNPSLSQQQQQQRLADGEEDEDEASSSAARRQQQPRRRRRPQPQQRARTKRVAAADDPSYSRHELVCPICRSLLREPVRLPCAHHLCLGCLRGSEQHSSLACPLCRRRVGSWLRANPGPESLVDQPLWRYIRDNYPGELLLEAAAAAAAAAVSEYQLLRRYPGDHDEFSLIKSISADGEIRKEYELQLQLEQEEMRRQREKNNLASEAFIQKLQEEEKQKMLMLAQDQLLAKTLAKQEVIELKNEKCTRSSKSSMANSSNKLLLGGSQSKSTTNYKMSIKPKSTTNLRKQSVASLSKTRSERIVSNAKQCLTDVQKEPSEIFNSQKPVPIHNAITRVVTHQNRASQPNNLSCLSTGRELIGSSSKIYGQQSEEELHVPSDVLSNKKKKLDVEVCVTASNLEDKERVGGTESGGSHDSINQEIHHFKPIKALPRTPFKTLDGKQIDPKLIRVLPIFKRVSNAVPKPPTPNLTRKMFECTWSAFRQISKHQVLRKCSPIQQHQEGKKTDYKSSERSRDSSKSSKRLSAELEERSADSVSFDSNKNYTKNVGNKIVNGTKFGKKLENEQTVVDNGATSGKPSRRGGKLRNGLLPNCGKHNISSEKIIEVVQIDDDEMTESTSKVRTPDPLAMSPKVQKERSPSPVFEIAMENIAERIKRRKTTRNISNNENAQGAINTVESAESSTKSKIQKASTKSRKQKTKKPTTPTKSKTKTKKKVVVTTTVTSQIKRLAAKSARRPRYTEDSESEEEPEIEAPSPTLGTKSEELKKLETTVVPEPEQASVKLPSPSPRKRPRKNAKPVCRRPPAKQPPPPSSSDTSQHLDDEAMIREQERLHRLAEQERKDLELAQQLQARFDAMERVAGRTRRGIARLPSPLLLDGELVDRRKAVASVAAADHKRSPPVK